MLNKLFLNKYKKSFFNYKDISCNDKGIIKMFIIYSLLTFIAFIGFAELTYNFYMNNQEKAIRENLFSLANQYSQRIQENLINEIYVVNTLEVMLKLTDYDVESFYKWGPPILESNPNITSIQLAPNGIVQYIYPLEGNEKAIGHNLLKDVNRDDGAIKAIKDKAITFIGPVKLIQNGKMAVIARKPIFKLDNGVDEFWGFTIVLINIENILIPELKYVEEKGLAYRILGNDPDRQEKPVIISSSTKIEKWEASYPIVVPNGQWTIEMTYIDKRSKEHDLLHLYIILGGIILATLYCTQHFRMIKKSIEVDWLNEKLTELSYTDELTNIKNRRGVLIELELLIEEAQLYNRPLSIGMIDIDFFKDINDSLGHDGGDNALKHIINIFKNNLDSCHTIGRTGGDEFICIFRDSHIREANMIAKGLEDNLKGSPFIYLGKEISLTFSMGIVQYDIHGDTLESLINRADKALYDAKLKGRNQIICM
ncbi:sensor domain-containing diguanylate cyclase [Anaeromicrobium sediminis]|nr:sensor domain-containing diguanylate cyclase [Anaeromicrobium sediminis]